MEPRGDLWITVTFAVIIAIFILLSDHEEWYERFGLMLTWIIAIPMNIVAVIALVAFMLLMIVVDLIVIIWCLSFGMERPDSQTGQAMDQIIDIFNR